MNNQIKYIVLILTSFFLIGCGPRATGPVFNGLKTSGDNATIYVIPKIGEMGATDTTYLDVEGTSLDISNIALPSNGFLKFDVPDGSQTKIINHIGFNAEYNINAKKGEVYCLEAKITSGFWGAYSHLYRVSKSSCEQRIKNLRLAN